MGISDQIAVLGAGAWGTALASLLAADCDVSLWGRDRGLIADISQKRENQKYLPGVKLPDKLLATYDLNDALNDCSCVLLVVPVKATQEIGGFALEEIGPSIPLVCCSKGIDPHSHKTPVQLLQALKPNAFIAALSGPSFAVDVVRGLPTAVALAHKDITQAEKLAGTLSRDRFRIYAQQDVMGVELGGALKNVIALAVGVCRGLKLGASAEAAVIARGFSEVTRLVTALGGKAETLNGLSGMGDLVLSCSNEKSRNFSYGIALARGENTVGLPLAEGVRTAQTAVKLAADHEIDCPIMSGVSALLDHQISPDELVTQLLMRPLTREHH